MPRCRGWVALSPGFAMWGHRISLGPSVLNCSELRFYFKIEIIARADISLSRTDLDESGETMFV